VIGKSNGLPRINTDDTDQNRIRLSERIADIAGIGKAQAYRGSNTDERGSGNRKTFTTEDTKEHRGVLEIEQNLFTAIGKTKPWAMRGIETEH
jgi:hypothetical protein